MVHRMVLLLWVCAMAIAAPARADKADDTLRVLWGAHGPLETLDFYFSTKRNRMEIASLVWDTLVWRDPADFSYKPLLAKAWRQVDDTTLEFDLRDDVTFHDGSKFTAADVVGTVNTVADPGFKVALPRNVNWIAAAVQTGMYQVQIVSKEPFPPALDYVANMLPIYPVEHYDFAGPEGMGRHPIGTGPYRIVSVEPAKEYRLVRNDNYYFKDGPKGDRFIRTIDIREVASEQTQIEELLAHHADIIWGLSADQTRQITPRIGFQVVQTDTMRIGFLALDAAGQTGTPALQSIDVRQAIAYAIDRQSIERHLMGGPAHVVDAPCHPAMFGCIATEARHYDYAPDKARDLLHSWGLEGKVSFDLYVTPSMQEAGDAITSDLGKVGITVRLRVLDSPALHEALIKNRTPAVLASSDADTVNDISELIGPAFLPGKEDYARDPELHTWLEQAEITLDAARRKELYAKAIERITDQVYWLPLFTFVKNYAFSDQVVFAPSLDGLARLYRVRWK